MTIIAIASDKGGTGKTTTAFNLAYLRAKEKGAENVLLIDADPRTGSATIWSSIRSKYEDLMPILVMKKSGNKDFIQSIKLLNQKYSDIIIDVGGDSRAEMNASMIIANKIYIPARPSYLDVFSLSTIDNNVGEVQSSWNPELKAFLLPTVVSPNNLMVVDDLTELKELSKELENMTLSTAIIRDRKAFRRSIKYGKTIFELTKEEKFDVNAVEEMTNFYNEVYGK